NDRVELAFCLARIQVAIRVDYKDGRNQTDAPRSREPPHPAITLIILRPGDSFLLDERLEAVEPTFVLRSIQAGTDELDASSMILGVQVLQVRHLGDARPTPSRPEMDHHHGSLESLDRDR